ncbi:MAG: hypothetical protein ACI9SY_000293 [Candidatus Paceibacteria bacterium]|jgi:hypothetical protein
MLYLLECLLHIAFWVATLVIVVNAGLIFRFGRYSESLEDYRYASDLYVLIGIVWPSFCLGFYFGDYVVGPTIFMVIGALLCIDSLKVLHERSLEL